MLVKVSSQNNIIKDRQLLLLFLSAPITAETLIYIPVALSDVVRGDWSRPGDERMLESIRRCDPSHGIDSETLV